MLFCLHPLIPPGRGPGEKLKTFWFSVPFFFLAMSSNTPSLAHKILLWGSLIAYYCMLFHSPLFSQVSVCLVWSFNQPVLKREQGECRQEGVWEMFSLFVQAAITWLNCLLGCCALALGEATMPCLFVCERLWLWLAASSSAAEHTIGTKRWGKESGYRFPLESIHCQAWTPSSGAQMEEAGKE